MSNPISMNNLDTEEGNFSKGLLIGLAISAILWVVIISTFLKFHG